MMTLKEKLECFLESVLKIKLSLSSIAGQYGDLSFRVGALNDNQLELASKTYFSSMSIVNGFLNVDITEKFITDFEKFKSLIREDGKDSKPKLYFEYLSPNLNTDMNLGVLRNAFLGKTLCKMLSKKYNMDINSSTMICDVGNLAEIMYYAYYRYPQEENFKNKYLMYINDLVTQGLMPLNNDSDPQSEQVRKFSRNTSKEYRQKVREQYKKFFISETAKIEVFFNEINFQSDYSDYKCKTYLDRDVNFILEKRQQGINNFCFIIGVDQGAHFFELNKKIRAMYSDINIYTIMHEFVRIEDKKKSIDDLFENVKGHGSYTEALSDIQLYYLSHPLNKSFYISEENIKKIKIGAKIRNFYKYKPLHIKQSFQVKKEIYLATMIMEHSADVAIDKMSPNFLVKRLDEYLKFLESHKIEDCEWQYCKKVINETADLLGIEYLKEDNDFNLFRKKLNNEESR